jgi:hypothetical protein
MVQKGQAVRSGRDLIHPMAPCPACLWHCGGKNRGKRLLVETLQGMVQKGRAVRSGRDLIHPTAPCQACLWHCCKGKGTHVWVCAVALLDAQEVHEQEAVPCSASESDASPTFDDPCRILNLRG